MKEIEKNRKLRAAIYLRVSTDEQAEHGYGIAHQDERLRYFVSSQEYTLKESHVYKDEGYSGTLPADQRPALQRPLDAAQRREFDIVVVYRLDRLGRKLKLVINCVERLEELGISFRSVTEPFDTSNPYGRYSLQSMSALAELERENIKERTLGGRRMAAKSGKWVWGTPPYGYRLDSQTKKLKIQNIEAKWVKQFFGRVL